MSLIIDVNKYWTAAQALCTGVKRGRTSLLLILHFSKSILKQNKYAEAIGNFFRECNTKGRKRKK